MPTELWVALIGLAGTLLAAYKDELSALFGGTKNSSGYAGTWNCEWRYVDQSNTEQTLTDTVTLKKFGSTLSGSGTNPMYGGYQMRGRANPYNAHLSYQGTGKREALVGSIILRIESPERLTGVWCQYLVDGTMRIGLTEWTSGH